MESFAIISLKGGVGKTTLTVNLGAALAELKKRVLLIDLDPQTDLTRSVGIDAFQTKGVEYLLERDLKFEQVVKTHNEYLDVLPASKKLKAMELSLSNIFVKAKDNYFCYLLKNVVEPKKDQYDFVLIDCPPSSGFLTINALAFVKNILIPVECQFLGFESTKRTISLISKVKRFSNREINPPVVVPLMFDARNKLSYLIHQRLQKAFNGAMTKSKINVNVSLAEAPAFGKTIYDYKPKSRGAKDFLELAAEMIAKYYPEDVPPEEPSMEVPATKSPADENEGLPEIADLKDSPAADERTEPAINNEETISGADTQVPGNNTAESESDTELSNDNSQETNVNSDQATPEERTNATVEAANDTADSATNDVPQESGESAEKPLEQSEKV